MSRDFCACPCPGTKGQRNKEIFLSRDNGTSRPLEILVSIRSYKKQPVKKSWGRILGLAWLKFAVAALLSTVVIDFQEKSHGYAYSGNYSQIKVSRVLSYASEKYVQKRKFLTAAFLSFAI